MKKSSCFPTIMLRKIVLVSVLLQITMSFDLYDDNSHQGLLTRMEKPGYWTILEDKKQPTGVLPYTRLDRGIFKLPQTIIPYPRAGRMLGDSDIYDYDMTLVPELALNFDYPFADNMLDNRAVTGKRASIAFPPRVGRKKRSISSDQNDREDDGDMMMKRQDNVKSHSRSEVSDWSDFDGFEPNFYLRSDRRPNSRSRNSFVPRVGKKSSGSVLEEIENKRALAFTPRIGRASLIPRIGRNDPRFKVKSRGSFIPRIGRRAALIPRIGRSESHASDSRESQ